MCRLYLALDEEAGVDEDDYVRITTAYFNRMDPTQPALACGCCGAADIPATDTSEADAEAMGILSFTTVALPNDALRGGRHECRPGTCRPSCAFFLDPLHYNSDELAAYNADFPSHIMPPLGLDGSALAEWQAEQQRDWTLYRRIISNVAVNGEGRAVSRVGLGKETAPCDVTGEKLDGDHTPLIDSAAGPPAHLVHLYPELCTGKETRVCGPCMRSLARRRRPEPSVAAGWDLGTPAYANTPTLSWAEKRAVSKTRILCTAFNIDVGRRSGKYCCNPTLTVACSFHIQFPSLACRTLSQQHGQLHSLRGQRC